MTKFILIALLFTVNAQAQKKITYENDDQYSDTNRGYTCYGKSTCVDFEPAYTEAELLRRTLTVYKSGNCNDDDGEKVTADCKYIGNSAAKPFSGSSYVCEYEGGSVEMNIKGGLKSYQERNLITWDGPSHKTVYYFDATLKRGWRAASSVKCEI